MKKDENEELYGGFPEWVLARFGFSEHHIELVKSVLDMVEKKEYLDRTEYSVNLKNVKVSIKK